MMEFFIDTRVMIIVAAIILDLLIGDPKWLPHPVIGFGKLITFMEKKLNRGSSRQKKRQGVLLLTVVVGIAFASTFAIIYFLYQLHMIAGVLVEVYLISSTIAVKGLRQAALQVAVPLAQGNLFEARRQLSMIVGRDTENLGESELVRGTVETVAENTVDGITAPLFWAFIGGAPFAMAYRAINTLDSMVGYKNERYVDFGWSSARIDDVVNWIPAKFTSITLWLGAFFVRGTNKRKAWQITLRDASKHPSPNSGWSEAMVAGLMGIQLGGRNYYQGEVSHRAEMGNSENPLSCIHINQSIRLMHGGWFVFFMILALLWIIFN
ncbi:adenosylcobinamide-phosphate synthase CbiB [Salipaludibacillus sp. HK11]|uniref:adenosylcobinamide-phosphate synthase CbiB n=1 Tax=Salipaludibacillus sp. HK11 TaxID=3394320 RepID=UPI0039FC7AD5